MATQGTVKNPESLEASEHGREYWEMGPERQTRAGHSGPVGRGGSVHTSSCGRQLLATFKARMFVHCGCSLETGSWVTGGCEKGKDARGSPRAL